jgi:hypothetical protein
LVPVVEEVVWALESVCTGAVNLALPPTGFRFPDRPGRSESLYELRCPGPHYSVRIFIGFIFSALYLSMRAQSFTKLIVTDIFLSLHLLSGSLTNKIVDCLFDSFSGYLFSSELNYSFFFIVIISKEGNVSIPMPIYSLFYA